MSKRSKLRVRYYKETLNHWKLPNSTMQPTVEYTIWLEKLVILNDISERQTPTEANNHPDTKQLIIGDVSKQRELLIAYTEYLAQQDITTSTYWLEVYNVDAFLKSNL